MQVRSWPVVAMRKIGAGQGRLAGVAFAVGCHLARELVGASTRTATHEMPLFGSEPRDFGAATTHTLVRFTIPLGQWVASAQKPSLRGLPSGHAGAHVPLLEADVG